MSRQKDKNTPQADINLDGTEVESLEARIQASNLSSEDKKLFLTLITTVVSLRNLVVRRKFGLLTLLRKIFGVKTEKSEPKKPKSKSTKKGGNPKGKGHGRKKGDDYAGANRVKCEHDQLAPGDSCPECGKGKLKEEKPAIHQFWTGECPIQLTIYELQRLVCNHCRAVYRAPMPPEIEDSRAKCRSDQSSNRASCNDSTWASSYPQSPESAASGMNGQPERSTQHGSERTYDSSADVMVAYLKYGCGVPSYRLAGIQKALGVPLPAGTQWMMIYRVFLVAMRVYRFLWYRSADSPEFYNDDTRQKILSQMAKPTGGAPIRNQDGSGRKGTQTSCILSQVDGYRVVLYATGPKNAGENLNDILALRSAGKGAPRQTCDGLAVNRPKDHPTVETNCLDHARRKFYDRLQDDGEHIDYVLGLFRQIYHNDKQTKGMSDDDRLAYHQLHSTHIVAELEDWMTDTIGTQFEENSLIGGAITYMRKRWTKLTQFLRIPGAPLSNAECERKIKSIIPHRKGSLFYKNLTGAFAGDCFASIIQTCVESSKSPVRYLQALCDNASDVSQAPGEWLPWNFEENLA